MYVHLSLRLVFTLPVDISEVMLLLPRWKSWLAQIANPDEINIGDSGEESGGEE
jgi:hypothetical protein